MVVSVRGMGIGARTSSFCTGGVGDKGQAHNDIAASNYSRGGTLPSPDDDDDMMSSSSSAPVLEGAVTGQEMGVDLYPPDL